MVAIVSGDALGLSLSSLATLGQSGTGGSSATGRSGERAYVNAATGNLVLQDLDDHYMARGDDLGAGRTYNSQGKLVGGVQESWMVGAMRQRLVIPANVLAAGSIMVRVDGDGAEGSYAWNATKSLYVTTAGSGAYDTVGWDAANSQYVWTDGATGLIERYDNAGRLVKTLDRDGNQVLYAYDAQGRIASVTGANQEILRYTYNAAGDLEQVNTGLVGGATTTRTRYEYDTSHRLTAVTVDLTPQDGVVADGKVYRTTYEYDGTSTRILRTTQSDGTSLSFTYINVGGQYRIATATDALSQVTTYSYDTATRRTTVTDPAGLAIVYQYDTQSRLERIESSTPADGLRMLRAFSYNANGDVLGVTAGVGQSVTYEYDANGNQTLQRDAVGNTVTRTYTALNLLATETVYRVADPDGAGSGQPGGGGTSHFLYDTTNPGRLRFVVSAQGSVTEYRYNAYGERIAQLVYGAAAYPTAQARTYADVNSWAASQGITGLGRVDTAYDAHGQLLKSTAFAKLDASGNGVADGTESVTTYTYGGHGELLNITDAGGGQSAYTYDGLGRVLSATNALSQATLTSYDDAGGRTTVTLANGLASTQSFDAAGRVTTSVQSTATQANLGTTRYAYDAAHRLVMTTDPNGLKRFNLYDSQGRLAGEVDADGGLTEYLYDAADRVSRTVRYGNRVNLTLLTDTLGQPTKPAVATIRPTSSAADRSSWTAYDAAGRIVEAVNSEGEVTEYAYDGASALVSTKWYANRLTSSAMSALGNTPSAAGISPTADSVNDRLERNFYDADGVLQATLDAEGYLRRSFYDGAGRLAQLTSYAVAAQASVRATGTLAQLIANIPSNSADATTTYLRNIKGQVAGEIDPEGFLTEYTYDRAGRLTSTTRYSTRVTVTYTTSSSVASVRPAANAADQTTTCSYDLLSRCIQETDLQGTVTTHTYDTLGNRVASLKTVTTTDKRALLALRYDVQGRLTGELTAEGYAQITTGMTQAQIDTVWSTYGLTHAYDAGGRRTSTTDPRGAITSFAYDAQGRLSRQTVDSATGGLKLATDYTYDTQGNLLTVTSPGGTLTKYDYDRLGRRVKERVDAATGGADLTRTWTYDANGNVVSSTDANTNRSYFFYDKQDQLIYSASLANAQTGTYNVQANTYDAAGRLARSIRHAGTVTGVTSATTTADMATKTAAIASPTADAVEHRVYDKDGRITATVNGLGEVVRYTYDKNVTDRIVYANRLTGWVPGDAVNPVADSAHDQRLQTVYDNAGRAIYTLDGTGAVSTFEYDKLGNLTKQVAYATAISPQAAASAKTVPAATSVDAKTTYVYDANSRLVWSADGVGAVTRRFYDKNGNITQLVQYATRLTAGQDPVTIAIVAATDRVTNFIYDKADRQTFVVDSLGTVTKNVYDANGNVTQQTQFNKRLTAVPAVGTIVSSVTVTTDSTNDRTTRSVWDAAGRLVFAIDATGAVTERVYDGVGNVTLKIDYATLLTSTNLTNFGATPSVATVRAKVVSANAQDRRTQQSFDAAGRLKQADDLVYSGSQWMADHTTAVSYDGLDRVTASTESGTSVSARTTSYTYDSAGRVLTSTNALNKTQTFTYDGAGNKKTFRNEKGDTWTYDYDAAGQLLLETSPEVDWTTTKFVATGTTVSVSIRTRLAYDALGNLLSRTEAEGITGEERTTSYTYDALGRQLRTTYPAVGVYYGETNATLLSNGQAGTASRADTVIALYSETSYDALGNAISSQDVASNLSYKVYDRLGRVSVEVDAMSYVTAYTRNSFGEVLTLKRCVNSVSSVDTTAMTVTYISSSTADRVLTTTYDRMGRVLSVTEGAVYVYDADGTTAATRYYTAAKSTSNTYNAFGEITQVLRPRTSTTGVTEYRYYNQVGRLTGIVDAGGYVTRMSYDGVGSLLSRTEYATAYTGTINTLTAPTATVNAATDRTTTYTYDALNRKITETRLSVEYTDQNAATITENTRADLTTTYGYDAVGNVVSTTNADGTTYSYYDELGRVVAVAQPVRAGETSGTLTPLTEFKRDAHGNVVVQIQYSNGASVASGTGYSVTADAAKDRLSTTSYDLAGRALATVDAMGVTQFSSYNAFGRVAKQWQTVGTTTPQNLFRAFRYDALGRVTSVIDPASTGQLVSGSVSIVSQSTAGVVTTDTQYNAFGEAVVSGVNGALSEYFHYDLAGRLWRTNSGDGIDKIFLYDRMGNQTADIRSAGSAFGNQDLNTAYYTVTVAAQDANLRRVDTRYDALGRVVGQTLAARQEKYSDVTVRSASVANTVSAGTTATYVGDESVTGWVWQGPSSVALSWSSLAGLGAGEVKVVMEYRTLKVTAVMEGEYSVTTYSAGILRTQTAILSSEAGASGTTLAIDSPPYTEYGGIQDVTKVTVYKKDVNGNFVEVIGQGLTGNVIDVEREADVVNQELQLYDTQTSSGWYAMPLTTGLWSDFGTKLQLDLRAYSPARYKFRLVGAMANGTMQVRAEGLLSQTTTLAGTLEWVRPVVTQTVDRWANVTSITDPRLATWKTTYEYNANNQLIKQYQPVEAANGTVTSVLTQRLYYDKMGRQVATKDANGNINRQSYDRQGNLVKETHADTGFITNAYNVFGERTSTVDAENNKDTFTYDKLGRRTAVYHWGEVLSTGATFGFTTYSSSRSGDLLTVGAGVARAYLAEFSEWDQAGRQVSQTNAAGEVIRYVFDLRGNIVKTLRPDGTTQNLAAFDTRDRKSGETDGKGNTATWTYDYFGRLTGHKDLGAATFTYTYDKARQLTSQTSNSSRGQNLQYTYDAVGQLTVLTDAGTTGGVANNQQTRYSYDLSGRKIAEKVVAKGVLVQDNHMAYDSLGRLRWVGDDHAQVLMEYDAVGNRTRVYTHVVNIDGLTEYANDTNRFFKYDAMNRQTVVDGVDAQGNLGTQGHRITYDKNGNRTSDEFWGNKVTSTTMVYPIYDESGNLVSYGTGNDVFTATQGLVTEAYRYDGVNRLKSIERDGMQIDRRLYDSASRVIQTGGSESLPLDFMKKLYGTDSSGRPLEGNGSRRQLNNYNANGQLALQQVMRSDNSRDSRVINDTYDAAGNLVRMRVIDDASGTTNIYDTSLALFEGYKEAGISGTSTRLKPGSTTSGYDSNGFLVSVTDPNKAANNRTFVNDAAGQVLAVTQGAKLLRQMIVNGETLGRYGAGIDQDEPRTSSGDPIFDNNVADFQFGYRSITPDYPSPSPGTYVVQSGDTLRSIAHRSYGDSQRWYQIAEANGISSDAGLRVGQSLNLPNLVGGASNADGVFQPYDPSKMVGDTMPHLAQPKKKSNWLKQLIMIIIIVVATILTAGALAAAGALGGNALGAATLAGVTTGGGLGATFAAGVSVLGGAAGVGAAAAAGALGAAAGSIAGQAFGMATGMQDKFNWKGVATSALGGAVTAGLGGTGIASSVSGVTGSTALGAAAQAAVGSMVSQGIGVVTGLQKKFDWKGVAASAAGAGVGQAVGSALGPNVPSFDGVGPVQPAAFSNMGFAGDVLRGGISAFAGGMTTAVMRGGKISVAQIATDAFGNALGSSLADASNGASNPASAYVNEIDSDVPSDNAYYDRTGSQWLSRPGSGIADTATNAEIQAFDMKIQGFDSDWSLEDAVLKLNAKTGLTGPGLKLGGTSFSYRSSSEHSVDADYSLDTSGLRLSSQIGVAGTQAFWDSAKGIGNSLLGSVQLGVDALTALGRNTSPNPVWAGADFTLLDAAGYEAPKVQSLQLPRFSYTTKYGAMSESLTDFGQLALGGGLKLGVGLTALLYSADTQASPLSALRRTVSGALGDSSELVRMTNSGVAVIRTGETSYAQIGRFSLDRGIGAVRNDLAALRDLEPIVGSVQRAVQELGEGVRFGGLSDPWQKALTTARRDYVAKPWIVNRMEGAAIGGYVDLRIGRRVEAGLIPEAAGFTKNSIGPDLTKLGFLPIEVTRYTPSLNAVITHAQRYNQSLAYALYRVPGLGLKP